eukprot:g8781.t1
MSDELHFRPLEYQDKSQLKVAHYDLFPVDYRDKFFEMACQAGTNIYTLAAFQLDSENCPSKLVGFIIGRSVLVSDINSTDRTRLGVVGQTWDSLRCTYILTIGVIKEFQQQGIATELLKRFEEESKKKGSKWLYLHVITYNDSAIQFYTKCSYECAALLRDFYCIQSGRQQDPNRTIWDAFLFVKYIDLDDNMLSTIAQTQLSKECSSRSSCWLFNTKLWFSQWSSSVREDALTSACNSNKLGFSESHSIFHRLFDRKPK